MATEFNFDRVEFFQENDIAYAHYRDRVLEILLHEGEYEIETINDCIEIHQVLQTVKAHPHLFAEYDFADLLRSAKQLFSVACKAAANLHNELGLLAIFDSTEGQYINRFWDFAAKSGLYQVFLNSEVQSLLERSSRVIHDVLEHASLLDAFDHEIAVALRAKPRQAAQLIISSFGAKNESSKITRLPSSLSNQDIDTLMMAFLSEEGINLNHVRILASWPSSMRRIYCPAPKVLIDAAKREKELTEKLFQSEETILVEGGINVQFSPQQVACKKVESDEKVISFSYSNLWLQKYVDYGTILNNFIYVFDFIETKGLLTVPAHKYERSALMEVLGFHLVDEYYSSSRFRLRQSLQLSEVLGYRRVLGEVGVRLEEAIEWFFNTYIEDEFKISGFHINLPSDGTSFLDRCRSVGPEIEGILKAFQKQVEEGEINPAYFPHMRIKLFEKIPSLIPRKYVVEGDKFVVYGKALFSDQSQLAFSDKHDNYGSFIDMVNSEDVSLDDYPEIYHGMILDLEKEGFIKREARDRIIASRKARIMFWIWQKGAFPVYKFSDEIKETVEELVKQDYAKYCESLFTVDEANYFNYLFNNAKFSDSLALRNKYDHASDIISDPNDESIEQDYCMLLGMMICIILKINDELMFATGLGGGIELVDWPLIDEGEIDDA